MSGLWNQTRETIFGDYNPYSGFIAEQYQGDKQGWNSYHPFLSDTISLIRPKIIVEIGVWKGASTIFMAEQLKKNDIDGIVIAVDTFLGSWDHYFHPEFFPSLMFRNGYPTLFYTFLTNVIQAGINDYVLPLPLDSTNAGHLLGRKEIRPDLIHIDAGHDVDAVTNDLKMWWPCLAPGGMIIADDYDASGEVWPTVRDSVDMFLSQTPHENFEASPYKARWSKPKA